MVVHLSDIVFRRTTMAIEGLLTIQGLREIGAIAAAALQWDAQRLNQEIDDVVMALSKFHGQTLTEENMRRAAGPAAR
jgi:glycerol-3-phosphate dehydrogenase